MASLRKVAREAFSFSHGESRFIEAMAAVAGGWRKSAGKLKPTLKSMFTGVNCFRHSVEKQ